MSESSVAVDGRFVCSYRKKIELIIGVPTPDR